MTYNIQHLEITNKSSSVIRITVNIMKMSILYIKNIYFFVLIYRNKSMKISVCMSVCRSVTNSRMKVFSRAKIFVFELISF